MDYILTELTDTLKKMKCNIIGAKTRTEIFFEFRGDTYIIKLKKKRKKREN